jgi:GntR family transcriptional regulator / MocR family aminotransferase
LIWGADVVSRTALGIVSLARNDGDLALAERLFDNLRNRILDGIWRHGDKLPGTRIIARDAGVSRWTAVVAVDMLIAEGLVEARKRSGTYVAYRGATRRESAPAAHLETAQANVPFALSVPALDLFPMHVWRRLQARRWRQMPTAALEDGDRTGWPVLRQAIAEFATTVRSIQCTAEQVVVVPSVEAAGRLVAQVLCRPGSLAWVEDPSAPNVRAIVQSAQLTPVSVATDDEGIDVDDGCRLAPLASLAVVTSSVQFPTGVRMSEARRRRLLEWSASAGAWIFEVDHNSEFPFGSSRPLASLPGAKRVVYFDTFGKMLFPALRVAYLIVPRDAAARFHEAAMSYDRPPSVPNQIILADFLASGQFAKHLRRCREAYAERRDALVGALRRECADVLAIDGEQHGLFVCARLARGVDDVMIARRLREAGVVVEPLSPLYARPTDQRGLLLGFAGHKPELIRGAAAKLGEALRVALSFRRAAAG